jgi:hypothetical protein
MACTVPYEVCAVLVSPGLPVPLVLPKLPGLPVLPLLSMLPVPDAAAVPGAVYPVLAFDELSDNRSEAHPANAAMHKTATHLFCLVMYIFSPPRWLIKVASHLGERGAMLFCSRLSRHN